MNQPQHNSIIMDGLLISTLKNNDTIYKTIEAKTEFSSYYYVANGKARKISEKEALREYLDPGSIPHIRKANEVFPKSVNILDNKWDETKQITKYRAGLLIFTVTNDFRNNIKVEITEGKLWRRQNSPSMKIKS